MGLISRVSSRTYRLKMQIFLQDQEIHTVEVTPETLVGDLVEFEGSRLQFAGETLDEEKTLGDYLIEEEATIQIIHPVLGGGRKERRRFIPPLRKSNIKERRSSSRLLNITKSTEQAKLNEKDPSARTKCVDQVSLWPTTPTENTAVNVV